MFHQILDIYKPVADTQQYLQKQGTPLGKVI